MNALHETIQGRFEQLSPELQRAARWVNDHPLEVVTQSMRRSAAAAGVAPATMTRLAKSLGFSGFEAMRVPQVQQAVQGATSFSNKAAHQQAHKDEASREIAELVHQQLRNVSATLDRNTVASLEVAADLLLNAKQVLFLGMRAAHGIAFHLHYSLHLLMAQVRLADDRAGTVQDQLWELGERDVLVAVGQSPYSRQTVELAKAAAQRGIKVLALTDSALGPLAQVADTSLLFDAESPSFFHSLTGAQATAEALVATVAARGGEAVMRRLVAMEQRLAQAQSYIDKPSSLKSGTGS